MANFDYQKLVRSVRTNMSSRSNVLILYNSWFMYAETLRDHVESFSLYSDHNIFAADITILDTAFDLDQFDVVVLHYSLIIAKWHQDLPDERRKRVSETKNLKILFIQDEYRWINATTDAIAKLGIDVVFTVQPDDVVDQIYKTHPYWNTPQLQHVRFEHTLTGFVDERLLEIETPPYENRTIDVSYRARLLPFGYGRSGREKGLMADRFTDSVSGFGLKLDISTSEFDRIYANKWISFVANSKATLGSESCVGLADFDNTLFYKIDKYVEENPDATFEDAEAAVFPDLDGRVNFRSISPRCFEAAALRTLMIMYEGEYSGILKADYHYVKLERDHSNIQDVVAILKSETAARPYIERAYEEIACSSKWTSRAYVKRFDEVVRDEMASRKQGGIPFEKVPYKDFISDIRGAGAREESKLPPADVTVMKINAMDQRLELVAARLKEITDHLPVAGLAGEAAKPGRAGWLRRASGKGGRAE